MRNNIFRGFQALSLFIIMLVVVSCQDQNGVQPIGQDTLLGDEAAFYAEGSIMDIEDHASLGRRGCVEIVFPVTIDFPGGSSAEVSSYEEMFETIKAWKIDNPEVDGRPMLALPFDVIHKNGEVTTIETVEMLTHLRRSCIRPDRPMDRNRCFNLVFPQTIVFPDGSTLEVADKMEMRDAIMQWKEDHPDSMERPTLQFPVEVEVKGGKILTIESQEQLIKLQKKCKRDGRPGNGDFGACFKIVFPVSLVFPDGTTTDVAGPQEIHQAVREWKLAHPDSDERVMLEFPLTVTFKDGTTQEVGSKEELAALKLECK